MSDTLTAAPPALEILPYAPERASDFARINAEWIEEMFTLEDVDREVLNDPEGKLINPGGDILFAALPDNRIVGAGALRPLSQGIFELTKMGVTAEARGHKAGEALLAALIARARELGATDLVLLTNSKCEAAIHLYEKLGFVHSTDVKSLFGSAYCRCDVAMRYGSDSLTPAAKAHA
ncbi:GNAT family N-acetyltransferase [Parvularcula marina]|uniref:N-acetyltransferase n=1 Tax=Parvularcula marina TaxID=2292771 RepID=A0A371RKT5_9PROT|nr:GNAT family N-acetyltransferase [Parvularcula marina]RFB05996.1 N-acetyltransferase [Parvularcula marina]